MADEAFALSPISARAALPSEEDYEAISEAFMETTRGRWFLGEYAKRNRNADTRMVLDAVARIEQSIAAQRQPAPDSGVAKALVAIGHALEEARTAAAGALDSLALEENLAPIRKGARVIKEIAWRWREIGADSRICDLLDSQVSAIEEACGQLSLAGPRDALSAAFDLVEQRVAGFGEGDGRAPPAAEPAAGSASPAPPDEMPAASVEADAMAAGDSDAAMGTAEISTEAAAAPGHAVEITAKAGVADISNEAADADDEALLQMVALEMGAPDPYDDDEFSGDEVDEAPVAELPAADPIMIARETEPEPEPPAMPPSAAQPAPEHSLGSSLIASGIVRRPDAATASDPLAPIRRMSQAEKIALFS